MAISFRTDTFTTINAFQRERQSSPIRNRLYMHCAHVQTPNPPRDFIFCWELKIPWIIVSIFWCIWANTYHWENIYTPSVKLAMLSLWKAGSEPCVAWKHTWDEIGDIYKKMGDNTVNWALKQKGNKGICQEIKAQTSWMGEDSDAQIYTVFSDMEVEECSSNQIPLSYFETREQQCKILLFFFYSTLCSLYMGQCVIDPLV